MLFETVEVNGVEVLVVDYELAESIIYDIGYSGTPGWDEFKAVFDIDSEDYLCDPEDTFYQGIEFTRLVTRRTDGAVFGAMYWSSPGNDFMESNTDQPVEYEALGRDEWDWEKGPEPVIFLPVRKFERVGYELDKTAFGN